MLTPRWRPMLMHAERARLLASPARHRIVAAGRRSGKTEDAKRIVITGDRHHPGALCPPDVPNPRFGICGPTRDQVKRIWWNDIKALSPPEFVRRLSESELSIRYVTGAELVLIGLDRPQRAEGDPFDGLVVDESAEVKESAWESSLRPTLGNRGRPPGWSLRIGRPKGRNHFYKWFCEGSTVPDHASFHWHSSVVLPPEEIEAARRDMDPLTFQQEYEASFVSFEGLAYYQWSPQHHLRPLRYDPELPLIFCFDFNVDPGVAAVVQEQMQAHPGEPAVLTTCCIGEVWIPHNSNTPRVCAKLAQDWQQHRGDVLLYGDQTGGARKTSQTEGTDWDLIQQHLRTAFPGRLKMRVARRNPPERDRVNTVNSRLRSASGAVRLLVDPARAPHVVRDMEGVTVIKGGSGELDKPSRGERSELTHISDALGYYVHERWPVGGSTMRID